MAYRFTVFLFAYFIICLLILALRALKLIKCEYVTIFIAFFVPVWGFVMLVLKRRSDRDSSRKGKTLTIKDKETRADVMMNAICNVNRSIAADENEVEEKNVQIEEPQIIKDTETGKPIITDEYLMDLENYISSGMLTGEALKDQLRYYSKLLEELLEETETKGRWTILNKKAEADLKTGDAEALDMDVMMMLDEYPDRERGYLFKLQSAVMKKDYGLIMKTVDEINEKNIFMSAELKSAVTFWNGRKEEEQAG